MDMEAAEETKEVIIFYSGVHRPSCVKLIRKMPLKIHLMGTFFDVMPGKKPSHGGLRQMRRILRKKRLPTW